MQGCTNPYAVNYNSAATTDDGSCIFLYRINGVCYAFAAEPPLRDESFTLSMSLDSNNWVFYHDYIPDFYFRTRDQLFSLKNKRIYRHNQGLPGRYYNDTPASFFIDIVFAAPQDIILNTVNWISEVLLATGAEQEFSTITHITAWNNQQCTGRIAISELKDVLEYITSSKRQGYWSFNDFRDALLSRDGDFLQDLFGNFAVKANKLATQKAWFDETLMEDRYFIIRLEYDNSTGNTVLLHSASINNNVSDL